MEGFIVKYTKECIIFCKLECLHTQKSLLSSRPQISHHQHTQQACGFTRRVYFSSCLLLITLELSTLDKNTLTFSSKHSMMLSTKQQNIKEKPFSVASPFDGTITASNVFFPLPYTSNQSYVGLNMHP